MKTQLIFGYGSLVNGATHDYGQAQHTVLRGWRRQWHFTSLRDLAFLSATPDPAGSVRGVVLNVPTADAALEDREQAYGRTEVSSLISPKMAKSEDISVFAIPPAIHRAQNAKSGYLLSYIDVVVQGYLHQYGEAGVQEFFETTGGWGARIIDDRAAPIYPRHLHLTSQETELTDHWLHQLAAEME